MLTCDDNANHKLARLTDDFVKTAAHPAKGQRLVWDDLVSGFGVRLTPAARKAIADLGQKPVAAVGRSNVLRVADAIKRGTADQFMAMVSTFYNWSYDRGIEVVNPPRNRLRVTGGSERERSRKASW